MLRMVSIYDNQRNPQRCARLHEAGGRIVPIAVHARATGRDTLDFTSWDSTNRCPEKPGQRLAVTVKAGWEEVLMPTKPRKD